MCVCARMHVCVHAYSPIRSASMAAYLQMNTGARLLRGARHDLMDVVEVCEGRKKQTNYLMCFLTSDLTKGSTTVISGWLSVCWVGD